MLGDWGRGGGEGLGGQLRSELRRIARPSSYWPRSQSTGLGQGQTHEDLGDRANEGGQAQTLSDSQNQAQSNLLFAVDLDEFFGPEQFGEYLDFLSNQGDDSINHLRTLCRTLAEQLLTCKRQLALLEPASLPTSSSQLSTQVIPLASPMGTPGTPVLDQFLQEIGNIFRQRDGTRLQDVLQLEPPLPPAYSRIVSELNMCYSKGQDQALLTRCEQIIPVAEDGIGSAWGAFPDFLARYFRFLRDADPSNLADLYEKLKSLTK
jgi:hypothetical protein